MKDRCEIYRHLSLATGVVGIFALSACSAPLQKTKPVSAAAPLGWAEKRSEFETTVLDARWWVIFEDSVLDALEQKALAASPDLAGAIARVDEARALAGVAAADRSVSISFDPSANRARASETDNLPPFFPISTTRLRAAADASYEIDAWGRVKNSVAAARRDAAVAAADQATVQLTLTGDVARTYYQLRAAQEEVDVLKRTLALREDTLKVQQARLDAGLMNELGVARARFEIASTRGNLEAVERQSATLAHALAVLTGQPPAAMAALAASASHSLPVVPVGLPSEVLKRRPDVAAADFAIDASLARLGVARAAFFPEIKLTGSFGLESAELENFIELPSRIWSFGPSITLPLFDGGKNRSNYAAAEARLQQTVASYQGKVLTAFREVEDALSDLQWLARQSTSIEEALSAARNTAQLSRERYDRGLTNYLDTVDADRSVLDAERSRVQINSQRFGATIALAKAVGGGWTSPDGQNLPVPR